LTFLPESHIDAARRTSREAKGAYENAVAERSKCQREVNDLLQRKSSWTDSDVVRFTNLVRQDHLNEQAEAKAKIEASQSDQVIEQEFQNLTRAILNRYHEEQVWSDKIRSASTYGSLIALGLNLAIFVLAVIVVEPYKRKKMAQTFEKRIETLSLETKEMVEKIASRVDDHLAKQEALLAPLATVSVQPEGYKSTEDAPTLTGGISLPIQNREIMAAGFGAATAIVFCGALFLSLGR
jgi:sensitive to high expression protein 9